MGLVCRVNGKGVWPPPGYGDVWLRLGVYDYSPDLWIFAGRRRHGVFLRLAAAGALAALCILRRRNRAPEILSD